MNLSRTFILKHQKHLLKSERREAEYYFAHYLGALGHGEKAIREYLDLIRKGGDSRKKVLRKIRKEADLSLPQVSEYLEAARAWAKEIAKICKAHKRLTKS